ncbi:MAG TPA: M1 family metallopeptidase [Candidatus Limnocylindria bacterium]|nr:M1 family metallopeptidase [Candidatus Limnocylindria bacterium]
MNDYRLAKDVRPTRYALQFDLDLERWTFSGAATIGLTLGRPANEVTLHSVDLDIKTGGDISAVRYDAGSQTATLTLAKPLPAGETELTLRWTGSIAEKLRGLYRSTRPGERYAATQFEAADARRAFPCFDEPEFKARFTVELVHDASLPAIANMPIERTEKLANGRQRTAFRETLVMSPYLVAFTVGPYEATPPAKTTTNVECRVWLPKGTADQAIYARDAHVRAVEWLERYTSIPYPFGPKVDAIGIPDFEAGAMENPGAITYRTTLLAADQKTASMATFKAVFSVVAHELTHMWWGDLVTMAWWNDLWLNESFASFVGEKCTATVNPDWRFTRDVVSQNTPAFNLDSLLSTHPISMEAKNVDEANERFDAVTYLKGQGVLRMIENYLGEDDFRSGVRIYLDRHKWANATAGDFWRALDEASGRDVTGLATAWITEPGHPLVSCSVRESPTGLTVDLTQARFFADPALRPTAQTWPVPLVLRYGTSAGGVSETRYLLDKASGSVELPGATWYFPNAGGVGFYRYAFDDRSIALLATNIARLTPEERLSLLDDQWALARANKATVGQVLNLVAGVTGEDDLYVLQALAEILAWLNHNALRASTERAFRELVDATFRPQLEKLGWENREDDTSDEREKRQLVIGALGHSGAAADVRAEARRRIAAHLDGTTRLQPDVAGPIASVAAIEGDAALYDGYVRRMKEAQQTDPQEENRFRGALTNFRDPAIVERFARSIFTDLIRDQDRAILLVRMHGLAHAREAAFRTLKANWDEFVTKMDPGGKQRSANAPGQLTPKTLVEEAVAFLQSKQTPDIKETVAQAVERMRIGSANAERMSGELDDALGRIAQPAR